jgi:hypothetical protein
MKPYEKLRKYWDSTGSRIPTATRDESEIAALEVRYGVRLPADFREYLLLSCPPANGNMDEPGVLWWSLSEIKNIPDEYQHELKNPPVAAEARKYLFFADYLVWCWAWAIDCGDDENRGRVAIIGGVNDRFVADSFGEFVDRLIADHKDVY